VPHEETLWRRIPVGLIYIDSRELGKFVGVPGHAFLSISSDLKKVNLGPDQ
jgi:hypothetical protein